MKYKVGDKVKVVEHFAEEYRINGNTICPNYIRKSRAGKIVTIDNVYSNRYTIKEMSNDYEWIDAMFEGLATETPTISTPIKLEGLMDFKIKDYKIDKAKQTVVVFFEDGDVQKAKCCDGDTFDLERGIEVCVTKHICGGADKYHKAIKNANGQIEAIDNAKIEAEKRAEIKARQRKKRAAKRAKKREEQMILAEEQAKLERQARIEEQKEAILLALKEYNGDIAKVEEAIATEEPTTTVE